MLCVGDLQDPLHDFVLKQHSKDMQVTKNLLTRKHAHAILIDIPTIAGSEIWPHFSRVKVADEIFMPTMMTVIGAIRGGGIPGGTGKRNELTSQHKDEVERRKSKNILDLVF